MKFPIRKLIFVRLILVDTNFAIFHMDLFDEILTILQGLNFVVAKICNAYV